MSLNKKKEIKESSAKAFFISQLFIIAALLAIIAFSTTIFYKSSKQNSIALYGKTIDEVGDHMENFFLKGENVVDSTATSLDFMIESDLPRKDIFNYLSKISDTLQENGFSSFYGILDDSFFDDFYTAPDDYLPQETPWYTAAKKADGKTVLVSPYLDKKTDRIVFSISKLLSDGKSVISVDIYIDDIQKFANKLISNDSDKIFILDRQGTVVAHSDNAERGKNYLHGDNSAETRLVKRIFFNPDIKKNFETDYNDKPSLVFTKRLLNECYLIIISGKDGLIKDTVSNLWILTSGLLLIFIFTLYICTTNFKARYKISNYANMLAKYKSDLEHQVVDQWNQLDKKKHDLVSMQDTVIEGMATVIEYRDVNTGKHVQHTKHYVQMITDYLYENHLHSDEVDERYVNIIGNAAAMHDLGKIAISDRILNKPDKLNEDEYEMIKTHTILGAGLVRQVFGKTIDADMLRICIDVVQYHHEKWDGTGYPIGLIGEDIPLSARIMAIADVFDALVSKRVYKESVSVDEVFEIIKKDSGTHFDPELAQIFLSMQPEIRRYLENEG